MHKSKITFFNHNNKLNSSIETQLQLGRAHRLAGKLADAEKIFTKILGKVNNSNSAQAYFERSLVYLLSQKYDKALQDAEKLIDIDNKTAEYYAYYAKVNYLNGFYEAALRHYTTALELQPDTAEYYRNRGLTQIDPKKAQQDFESAIRLAPNDLIAYHNLSLLLLQQNQPDKAKLLYENLLKNIQENTEVLIQYGVILQQLQEHATAIIIFEQALLKEPKAANALCNKAVSQYKLGNIDLAKQDFIAAIAIDEQNANIHYSYSIFLKEIRFYEEATREFARAVSLNAKNELLSQQSKQVKLQKFAKGTVDLFASSSEVILQIGY
ncbi:MAG: tetratricopeptide repeat protein, partial [Gammaproteobacteria bacterium]